MKPSQIKSRQEWVTKFYGDRARCTTQRMRLVIGQLRASGWYAAMAANGPKTEQIAAVFRTAPVVQLVRQYIQGQRWFDRAAVEAVLGAPVDQLAGAIGLAKVGLAIRNATGAQVELLAADPREARFVNEARCGHHSNGYATGRLIEAILHIRLPRRGHANVTDDRRLMAYDELLNRWNIRSDDLLSDRSRARLVSDWTYVRKTA